MNEKASQKPNPNSSTENFLRFFELVIEFLKAILWPLVILFIFISLQQPLFDLVETLPFLINKSSEISVAGVSLKVDQKLQQEGSPKLRSAASHISKDALLYLLDIGKYEPGGTVHSKSEYFTDKENKLIKELKKRGLMVFHSGIADEDGYDVEYGPTELGVEVYNLIQNVLVEEFTAS